MFTVIVLLRVAKVKSSIHTHINGLALCTICVAHLKYIEFTTEMKVPKTATILKTTVFLNL